MFKSFFTCLSILAASFALADSTLTMEFGVGWRWDELNWNIDKKGSGYLSDAHAKSKIDFKDINMWTINGKVLCFGENYYFRAYAEYGSTYKGRAKEHLHLSDPIFFLSDLHFHTNNPIKQESEFYDFDIAAGYPFYLFCNRLSIIPTVGFTYDRQHILVRNGEGSSSSSGSGSISGSISNSHHHSHHSDKYRFTWYGPYVGADLCYRLDKCWTLFAELEGRFLNPCHQKRDSNVGVYFIDSYHKKNEAYGFVGTFGSTFAMDNCWFGNLNVNYRWMESHQKKDKLNWQSIGLNFSLGCIY